MARRLYVSTIYGFDALQGGESDIVRCFGNSITTGTYVAQEGFVADPNGVECLDYPETGTTTSPPPNKQAANSRSALSGCAATTEHNACTTHPISGANVQVCGNGILEGLETCDPPTGLGSGQCNYNCQIGCGHAGQVCCAGSLCLDSGLGCDQSSNQCVSCPTAPPSVQASDTSIFQGNNCFGGDSIQTVGGPCASGFRRVSFQTAIVSAPSGGSCTPSWASSDPTDCRVNVFYQTPANCSAGITCDTKVFDSNVSIVPAPHLIAELNATDGNNCLGVNHVHTVGGPCDTGSQRDFFSTTVVSGSSGSSCTPTWASSDPNDCTVLVDYITPADCLKSITCDTKVYELAVVPPTPLGCP
jgi:hypothetical protein